jgi:hypothetical protein
MKPIPLKIPPGMWRNGTDYESAGRWYDGNLVRWENGRLKPWGGWRSVLENSTFSGMARGGITWRAALGYRYAAIGTHTNLYIYEAGSYSDQTPTGFTTGRPDAIEGPGYGAGPYGAESYGTQRTTGAVGLDATYWSFDVFGETLLSVASSDGRIFNWVPDSGVLPAVLTNAPVDNVGVLVTDEGHVMALGAGGDRRVVAWCSQGATTTWTPASTNSAGDRSLKTGGQIKAGRIFNGTPMIFTDVDLHAMPYAGPPLIYNNQKVGDNCGIVGPNAHGANHDTMFWMGVGSFFTFDGVVRPLPCDLQDWLFGSEEDGITPAINLDQRTKVACGTNSKFNEVTWFFPSASSTENDLYITYNYKDKIWYKGELARTVWLDRGVFQLPLAVDASGNLFEHEVTYLNDGATRSNIFAQSGPMEIADGERVIVSNNMIPDAKNPASIQIEFICKTAPQGPSQTFGPYGMTPNSEGFKSIRITGRQIAVRVEQIVDGDWSLGTTRLMAINGGGR